MYASTARLLKPSRFSAWTKAWNENMATSASLREAFNAGFEACLYLCIDAGLVMEAAPIPEVTEPDVVKCRVCGEDTTHNIKSSFYGLVHRYGPTDHAFEADRPLDTEDEKE